MPSLTVTSKGQVTLKKSLLAHLGVAPGDKLEFTALPGGRAEVKAIGATSDLSDFIGCLAQSAKSRHTPASLDEMNAAISMGWSQASRTSGTRSLDTVTKKQSRKA